MIQAVAILIDLPKLSKGLLCVKPVIWFICFSNLTHVHVLSLVPQRIFITPLFMCT